MARRKKEERVRKPRRERTKRSRRSSEPEVGTSPDQFANEAYWGWLNSKHRAMKIIDEQKLRPYWLSIWYDGSIPVSGFYPCTMFRRHGRVYYGFLFREHRDECFDNFYKLDVRKELTDGAGNGPL